MVEGIPKELPLLGDAGLDGLPNDFPERRIRTPHKARRGHPLLPDQKLANLELSSVRMVVEHTLRGWKRFNILSFPFRHRLSLYDRVFLGVVGIVNFQVDWRGGALGAA